MWFFPRAELHSASQKRCLVQRGKLRRPFMRYHSQEAAVALGSAVQHGADAASSDPLHWTQREGWWRNGSHSLDGKCQNTVFFILRSKQLAVHCNKFEKKNEMGCKFHLLLCSAMKALNSKAGCLMQFCGPDTEVPLLCSLVRVFWESYEAYVCNIKQLNAW